MEINFNTGDTFFTGIFNTILIKVSKDNTFNNPAGSVKAGLRAAVVNIFIGTKAQGIREA
jgi:hypothetical protein